MVPAGAVGQTDFDQAILRAVAGVEKKRSILQGAEKESVAKHECGHALVSTAIASLIPTFNQVHGSPVCCLSWSVVWQLVFIAPKCWCLMGPSTKYVGYLYVFSVDLESEIHCA